MTIQDRLLSSGPADLGAACVEAADTIDALVEALKRVMSISEQVDKILLKTHAWNFARAALARVNGDAQ